MTLFLGKKISNLFVSIVLELMAENQQILLNMIQFTLLVLLTITNIKLFESEVIATVIIFYMYIDLPLYLQLSIVNS